MNKAMRHSFIVSRIHMSTVPNCYKLDITIPRTDTN